MGIHTLSSEYTIPYTITQVTSRHKIKMKWQYAILAFALFAASSAETYEEEEGDPIRLHFCRQRWHHVHHFQCHLHPKCRHPRTFHPCPWSAHPPLFGISLGSLFGSDSSD